MARGALRFLLESRFVTAGEALQRGLVSEVVPADGLDARLLEFCEAVEAGAPVPRALRCPIRPARPTGSPGQQAAIDDLLDLLRLRRVVPAPRPRRRLAPPGRPGRGQRRRRGTLRGVFRDTEGRFVASMSQEMLLRPQVPG